MQRRAGWPRKVLIVPSRLFRQRIIRPGVCGSHALGRIAETDPIMAHEAHVKAQALAMLMLGDAPQYVAAQLGLPYTTCKRWQGEAFALLRRELGALDLGAFGMQPNEPKVDTKKT